MLYIWGEVNQATALLDFHLGEAAVYNAYSRAGISGEKVSLLHVAFSVPTASVLLGTPEKGLVFLKDVFGSFERMKEVLFDMCIKIPTIGTETNAAGLVRFSSIHTVMQVSWVLTTPKEELLANNPAEYYFKVSGIFFLGKRDCSQQSL